MLKQFHRPVGAVYGPGGRALGRAYSAWSFFSRSRKPTPSPQQPIAQPPPSIDKQFFGREKELAYLVGKFQMSPGDINVVVGGPSVGKSRLVRKATEASDSPTIVFNCREPLLTDWRSFSIFLHTALFRTTVGMEDTWKLPADRRTPNWQPQNLDDLSHLLNDLRMLVIAQLEATGKHPVLIIDEAHVLQDSLAKPVTSEEAAEEAKLSQEEQAKLRAKRIESRQALSKFLNLLVVVSKEKSLAHVVLSSSEAFFLEWLQNEKVAAHVEPFVVGDLNKEDARAVYDTYVKLHADEAAAKGVKVESAPLFDDAFRQAGGRPLDLRGWVFNHYFGTPGRWAKATARRSVARWSTNPTYLKMMKAIQRDGYISESELDETEQATAREIMRDNAIERRVATALSGDIVPKIDRPIYVPHMPYDVEWVERLCQDREARKVASETTSEVTQTHVVA